ITDESDAWAQFGVWDADYEPRDVVWRGNIATVRVGERRFLQLAPAAELNEPANADEVQWTLQEIRTGRPLITRATQDQFVPQMVNFEARAGVGRLFAAIERECGVRGRWMHRRDDPTTYMEVYEDVKDEKAFEVVLEREGAKLGVPRKLERFISAGKPA